MANAAKDRLKSALEQKTRIIQIEGVEIRLTKWTYAQTLRFGGILAKELAPLVNAATRASAIDDMLKGDISATLDRYAAQIRTICTETIQRGNFETLAEAEEAFDSLSMEAVISLLNDIWKHNLGPLVESLVALIPQQQKALRGALENLTPSLPEEQSLPTSSLS